MRVIAFLVLLAVLPTVELAEQVHHFIDHVVAAEAADHTAHHDEAPADEHGCTGLIHLCSCHHSQVTIAFVILESKSIESIDTVSVVAPKTLADLNSPEPAQR